MSASGDHANHETAIRETGSRDGETDETTRDRSSHPVDHARIEFARDDIQRLRQQHDDEAGKQNREPVARKDGRDQTGLRMRALKIRHVE